MTRIRHATRALHARHSDGLTALACLLILAAAFALSAHAQAVIPVTVKGPKNTVTSNVTVNPAPIITNINCTPGTVNEGDMVSCVIVIDRPAPASGITFSVLNVPGVTSLVVAPGATTAQFSFTAAIPKPVAVYRPLISPFRRGMDFGLENDRFLMLFWYYWSA